LTQKHGFKPDPHHQHPAIDRAKGMGDLINLRKARKLAERDRARELAAANRLKHGRSRSERELAASRQAKAHRDLDRHRVETGDDR
jgi:hypothetical protein